MKLPRRRLLLAAAAAGLSLPLSRLARSGDFVWHGSALGSDAEIRMRGVDRHTAEQLATVAMTETERLEGAFSLYRPESELSRLNRTGLLAGPSQDFRLLVEKSLAAWEHSRGAFNPAIQPLWHLLARHFAAGTVASPAKPDIERCLALCDPSRITLRSDRIALAPGQALTFNGIAQGYVTDRAAELLIAEGLTNILVDLGEIYALPGQDWLVGIAGSPEAVTLNRRAIAQSAGAGTRFTADGLWHHLIDPISGRSANRFKAVTVTAPCATDADWLSTALYVAPQEEHAAIVARISGAEIAAIAI